MLKNLFRKIIVDTRFLFTSPYKVGIVSFYYPTKKEKMNNGVAIHAFYLSRELAKLGCNVHVFTKAEKKGIEKVYFDKGKITIHKIDTKDANSIPDKMVKLRISHFIFDNKVLNEITKENSIIPFKIIHTHGWLTGGAFLAKYLNNIKWVHTLHALEKNRIKEMSKESKKYFPLASWVEQTINHADAIISVSDQIKQEAIENYPIKKEKIYCIPNGVDRTLFNEKDNTPKGKKVLYVGRFSLEKGIDLITKIAEEILEKDKELKLEIIASDKNIPAQLQKIQKQFLQLQEKYGERFIWHREKISREELAKIYKESSIYIQPSRYEACPLCVLEAMSTGKPVICSTRGGMPELVQNAGILVPFNSKYFAKEILKLSKSPKLREKYSKRALEKTKKFTWSEMTKMTLIVYKKITKDLKKGEDKYGFT